MQLSKLSTALKKLVHHKLLLFWYQQSFWRYALMPLSGLYRLIIGLRRRCYKLGLFKTTRFNIPVIVVGNITLGGTGKTPLIIWLAHYLSALGFNPGIISRGYGGHAKHHPTFVDSHHKVSLVGDEAILLARHSHCPVVIDPNRVRAAQALITNTNCNIILSDDGLQHLALGRTLEIVAVDGSRGFGNHCCLPAGPLREPIQRLKTVDFILLQTLQPQNHTLFVDIPSHTFSLVAEKFINVINPELHQPLAYFSDKCVHAIAAIGHPIKFFDSLRSLGIQVIEHAYPDHHLFNSEDFAQFTNSDIVIMTEKDAVKCTSFAEANFWYLQVHAVVEEAFKLALREKLFLHS